jgi:hypothetical protein
VPSERTLGREGVYLPLPFGQRPFDVLIDRTKVGISFYISKFILLKFEKKNILKKLAKKFGLKDDFKYLCTLIKSNKCYDKQTSFIIYQQFQDCKR